MASNQLAAPSTMISVDRRSAAAALRREGKTYERIGTILGVSKQTAHGLVISALEARRAELAENIDDIRSIENERLDKLTRLMFARLDDPKNPDPEKTVQAILRISERRAKMNGVDAPTDYRITPVGGATPTTGDVDLSNLSPEGLSELEAIRERYDAIRASAQLPAGEPIAVVDAPIPDKIDV